MYKRGASLVELVHLLFLSLKHEFSNGNISANTDFQLYEESIYY